MKLIYVDQVLKCRPKTRCQRRSRSMVTRGRRSPPPKRLKVSRTTAQLFDHPNQPSSPQTPPSLPDSTAPAASSPTSGTPESVAMEAEVETPAAEPGERRSQEWHRALMSVVLRRVLLFGSEVKPDAAVDDWEAIATDEEKGETSVHGWNTEHSSKTV